MTWKESSRQTCQHLSQAPEKKKELHARRLITITESKMMLIVGRLAMVACKAPALKLLKHTEQYKDTENSAENYIHNRD